MVDTLGVIAIALATKEDSVTSLALGIGIFPVKGKL